MIASVSFAGSVISEIMNIRSENDFLLIDIAKRYPELKFISSQEQNKILIELSNTEYHKSFKFDIQEKENLLNSINFISDALVETKEVEGQKNVSIVLTLKQDLALVPKLLSTKDNTVKISFVMNTQPKEEISSIYNRAVEEQLKGNLNDAEMMYEKVLSLNPNFYLARFNLSKIFIDKQDYDKAISTLESLVVEFKDKSGKSLNDQTLLSFLNTLGSLYFLSRNYDKALEQFQNILNIDPNYSQAYYKQGLAYEKVLNLKKAKECFQKTIDLKPEFPDAI